MLVAPMNPVIIEDYDAHWPELFESFRARMAVALGAIAAAIEHVGSTAVPGLPAKPIIDIDVLLRSPADLPQAITRLVCIGYEHRGDLGIIGREAFRCQQNNFPHHLYVCPPNSREFRRHIAFRDYLRSHPADARVYARLKRELAGRFINDREAYNEAKTTFVEEVLQRASKVAPSCDMVR